MEGAVKTVLLVFTVLVLLAGTTGSENTALNSNAVCSYSLGSSKLFTNMVYVGNVIEIASSDERENVDSPLMLKLDEWVYTNPELRLNVRYGRYDEAVRKIFMEVSSLYQWRRGSLMWRKRLSYDSCVETTPSDILGYPHPTPLFGGSGAYGTSVHWSGVLYSLIRNLGVSENRLSIWQFQTEGNLGFDRGVGHTVLAYRTDSSGEMDWWILDLTCCQSLVWLNDWRSQCSQCSCADSGCIASISDVKAYGRDELKMNSGDPFSNVCNC